ncbi:Cytochrome c oxidase assembly protein COX19 [Tetrabaena socialis]|uniref:Cytochrome c oxidase assembly protein COX19 n=1 Tax=Tetrabaena socialis TaxID=47790 RepID=A0A2J7ZLQ9_9CHLO|nr:Cytochrome c oxidase assembly protein COX19 [Tetrabaena socialis]|eukprot:PNH01190.1 Cytochrome c oxidase assembly protein COX19 [Tetrabaena socialis]
MKTEHSHPPAALMSKAFGGPRTQARGPEKGVFPLDHFAECQTVTCVFGAALMSKAFGGPRTQARGPEKGVFPLDHFAECQTVARRYLACLDANEQDAASCVELSREYLQCRMQRNLMATQDLRELGLVQVQHVEVETAASAPGAQKAPEEAAGS